MKKQIAFIVALLALVLGCRKDFIVENISKKTLTVNAPANNTVTTLNLVSFWWDALDGAEQYNLQIVKPDFSKPVQLLLDTNIAFNKFNFSLKPGSYQWRIKASNAGHATVFQTFDLRIDTTSDLTEQLVSLVSPANGAVRGSTVITFNWTGITAAKKYRLQINEGLVLDTLVESKTTLTYSLSAAKNATTAFTWNVKAINEASESQFNATPYALTIDLKGPSLPLLKSPAGGLNVTQADTLIWIRGSDAKYDSIYIADDTLFTNVIIQEAIQENHLILSELGLPVSPAGAYYWWKIRSFDAYGNPSSYSSRRKFRIIP